MSLSQRIIQFIGHVPTAEAREVGAARLGVVMILAAACFFAVGARVTMLAFDHSTEAEIAPTILGAKPVRGDILDRNNEVIATTVPAFELYADPAEILDPREAASALASVLTDISKDTLHGKLTRNTRYVQLAWRLSPKKYAEVLRLGIAGIHGKRSLTRVYPNTDAAAHLIGGVNKDNDGIAGIEHSMNQQLAAGQDIQLSLDLRVQAILRHEMTQQIKLFEAIGGAAIVQNIDSGEILAMVSLPDYNANHFRQTGEDNLFNRATKGVYELGSTFKPLNTAIALESGQFSARDIIDVVSPLRVGRFSIRDFHPERIPLNLAEVLIVSSNKGSARIAAEVGAERLRGFFDELGLFEKTPIEILETGAPLIPRRWGQAEVMTMSYGHGISVTPLHLASAIATATGNGLKIEPTLLRKDAPREFDIRVFSPETVRQVRAMMRRVVSHPRGTGNLAETPGYLVAGKTGTAEKIAKGGYNRKANITTFVGVFPAHQPRYVVLTMVDEPKPQKHSHGYATAGWVAAPVAGRIIHRIAPLLGVRPVDENLPEIRRTLMLDLPQLEAGDKAHASF